MLNYRDRQKWILGLINVTTYSEETGEIDITDQTTDAEKIAYVIDRLKSEALYDNNIKRFKGNLQNIIADHLQGIPSWINIPYSNHEILEYAKAWGYDVSTEKKEDKFCGKWWNACAASLTQLINNHGGVK